MNRKRSKIDHKRVFSNLLGKFNEKPPNFQNRAKPRNKQHVHKIEELKEDLQNLRESEIQRKEKRMQIYSEIEERKRVLATNQLKVMNLEETVAFHNMNPEEQNDYLDYTLECKKAQLKEVMVDVDSLQDEFSALKVEYEMTSVECAKQIACARDMELDAKQKLENAKQCEHNRKSDLELLTTFRKTQKVYMDDMNKKNWKLHFNIPLEIRGSEYCSIDPKQPREEQIERNLQNLKQFCENQIEYARVKFEKGLEEKKLWEEAHAEEMEEMEEVAPKTSREWRMAKANYPEDKSHSMQIRTFQESSLDKLDLGNMNWKQASKFCENFPDNNAYGITVHLTTNRIVKRVTLVKNELEFWKPSPNVENVV